MTAYPEFGSEPTKSLRPIAAIRRDFLALAELHKRAVLQKVEDPRFTGVLALQKVLHYWFHWQYLYATLTGYGRVSTDDQDTAAQVAALEAAGWERIYKGKASGGRWDRP